MAELGQRALAGGPLDVLLEEAAGAAARELGTELVSILELTGDRKGLHVRTGLGFPDGVVGGVLSAGEDELPGYALNSDGPVVVEDFERERRFRASPVQRDLGVVSAMAAPIGAGGRHFGVFGVHSRSPQRFSADDASFAQAIANVIGAAVVRLRAEELTRDSEARFSELANRAPALMWMTDPEGHVTFVNEGWLRFTGRSLEQELGDTFGGGAHPDDVPRLREQWRQAIAERSEFRAEYRLRHRDGGYRWVLDVGVPRRVEGEFAGYVGTAADIHERKQAEEALRESEARFRELADTAPVMIWTTDTEGLVTFINQTWLDFTGTTLEEELGATWTLGVHPEDADEVLATWTEALSRREPWERVYRLRRQDGDYRWIVDRGVPRWEGSRFAGYVGTAFDIHERKTVEDRLREVYDREHKVAETLQRSMLPAGLPTIEGVEVAARYLPAGEGAAIGGDWYDALELPDGRVAVVVGDVVGHGLRAAAMMGQLRTACRSYALVEPSPAEVMARLNRLVNSGGEEVMATILYLVLDRESGELCFSCAGHPPALLLRPEGPTFLEGGRSVPVGAADAAVFREDTAELPPGATLLIYTDGLVERRDTPLEDRLAQLAVAGGAAGDDELGDLCDQVLAGVIGPRRPPDDVALLALRLLPSAAGRLELSLPADPASLRLLRRRLGRYLAAAGADETESYEVTLAVCEAAGNAIEHAYGPGDATYEVEATLEDGEMVASVRDRGSWREPRGVERGRGLTIIHGLMDSVDVEPERGGTVVRMRRRIGSRMPA